MEDIWGQCDGFRLKLGVYVLEDKENLCVCVGVKGKGELCVCVYVCIDYCYNDEGDIGS